MGLQRCVILVDLKTIVFENGSYSDSDLDSDSDFDDIY